MIKKIFVVLQAIYDVLCTIHNDLKNVNSNLDILENHTETIVDVLEDIEKHTKEIKANTDYEPDDFTIDEDESNDHTADEIKESYMNMEIAIVCSTFEEWKESIITVSKWNGVLIKNGKRPIDEDEIIKGFNNCKDFHCIQKNSLLISILTETPMGNFFVIGNSKKDDVEDDYTLIKWSDIRDLFIKSSSDAITEDKGEVND